MFRSLLCVAALLIAAGCSSNPGFSDGGSVTPGGDQFSLHTPHHKQHKNIHRARQHAVPAAVQVSISTSGIRVGSTVTVSGRVTPRMPGHTVYLQHRTGFYTWVTVQHQRLSRLSRFHFVVRPAHSGTFAYRIRNPRAAHRVRFAVSQAVRVSVRPRPVQHTAPPPQHQSCTPGYSPCIPPAYDVDCASGSGDGPAYVEGPVRVTGSDPYDLDSDGDGVACES